VATSSISVGNGRRLAVEGLEKAYGSTRALRGLSLTVAPNQVIGVVGPNGAGKSTLVRILAGEETEDAGRVQVDGEALSHEQRRRFVAVVHQEPQLFPNLSVVENLMIDRQGLRRPKPTPQVFELLDGLQIRAVANAPLESTSIVVWQLTEIARALLRSAEVFLFDEPNSALTKEESQRLFEQMEALSDAGKFVFLVSHRLSEVAEVCRRVVVVRDGTIVASLSEGTVSSDRLSSLLIAEEFGEDADESGKSVQARAANRADEVAPAAGPKEIVPPAIPEEAVRPSSAASLSGAAGIGEATPVEPGNTGAVETGIQVRPGFVIAVTGPEGGGGRELARAATLPGLRDDSGERGGRAYMPADRRQCLFFNMSVAANISSRLERAQLPGEKRFVNRRLLARAAASYIERFNIKAEHAGASIGSLSGGNQQKVALASALAVSPALLIVEEPTRGVDIKTKLQIYEILRNFVASDGAVVMFVNELDDALGCADYLYVVAEDFVRGCVAVNEAGDLEQLGLSVNRLLSGKSHAA
jgi:ABC-type sugar transport system ATPase subunit